MGRSEKRKQARVYLAAGGNQSLGKAGNGREAMGGGGHRRGSAGGPCARRYEHNKVERSTAIPSHGVTCHSSRWQCGTEAPRRSRCLDGLIVLKYMLHTMLLHNDAMYANEGQGPVCRNGKRRMKRILQSRFLLFGAGSGIGFVLGFALGRVGRG